MVVTAELDTRTADLGGQPKHGMQPDRQAARLPHRDREGEVNGRPSRVRCNGALDTVDRACGRVVEREPE